VIIVAHLEGDVCGAGGMKRPSNAGRLREKNRELS
jgi:hypothetical protein